MKKTIYMLGASLALMAGLASCDKDTEGLTGITYYPTIELDGSTQIVLSEGETFDDPGYYAELGGEDVTADVQVTTDLDVNEPGLYTVNYVIYNADGFAATASRSIIVSAPGDEMSGFYTTDPASYLSAGSAKAVYNRAFPMTVVGYGDGTYWVDDLFGGYYALRAGYGSNYAMQGEIALEADNTLSLIDSYLIGWGDSVTELEGTFDPDTQTLSWVAYYPIDESTTYLFHVTATKD